MTNTGHFDKDGYEDSNISSIDDDGMKSDDGISSGGRRARNSRQYEEKEDDEVEGQPQPQQYPNTTRSSSSSSPPTLTEEQREHNRVLMTILHYVLTYPRWSLSLFLLLAGRSLMLPSVQIAIHQPIQNMETMARFESQRYQDCVTHTFQKRYVELERLAQEEYARVVSVSTTTRTTTENRTTSNDSNSSTFVGTNDDTNNIDSSAERAEESVRDRNRRKIQQSRSDAQSCTDARQHARRAIQVWSSLIQALTNSTSDPNAATGLNVSSFSNIASNNILLHDDTTRCSVDDRQRVSDLLGIEYDDNNADQVESAVATLFDAYRSAARRSTMRLIRYAQDRSTYDYNYFIGVKIQGTIDILEQFQLPDLQLLLSIPENMLIDALLALLQRILDALRDAYVRVDLLTARLLEFEVSIQAFYVNYVDLYGRLSLASDFVRDFLPSGIPLPPYLDLTGVPVADLLLPPVFEVPTFAAPLVDIDDLISDYIREAVILLTRLVADLAEKAAAAIRQALEELLDALREILTLEDYDPPRYIGSNTGIQDPDEEMEYLVELGATTQRQTRLALEEGRDVGNNAEVVTQSTVMPDVDLSQPSSLDEVNSTSAFGYLEPQFPSISIPRFLQSILTWVLLYQWIIELAIQTLRLWRLKQRYERDAAVELPEINYIADDEDDKEEKEQRRAGTMATVQLTLMKQFMTPWTAIGLILLPFAILGVAVWFPHVRQYCVTTRQGTVWARTLIAPLVINKANIPGNTLHSRSESDCYQMQRRLCRQMYSDTDVLYRRDLAVFLDSERRINESASIVYLFDQCLRTGYIDERFEAFCCGLEGYRSNCTWSLADRAALCPIDNTTLPPTAFRPLSEYLRTEACHGPRAYSSSLEDSRFNCEVLQRACDVTPCAGVDSELLEAYAIEADCRVQVYVIKCCFLVLLAIYHAVMVNLFSTLAFSSVKHLRWRSLQHDGIKLKTHMTPDGELVKGATATERADRITQAMRRFELVGWVQLVLTVVVFVFWFISFFVFRRLLREWNNV